MRAYTEHNYAMVGGVVSPAMKMIGLWQDVILLAGVVFIPLCLIGLGLWHAWGPRTARPDGKSQVTYPFAARGWVWGVAGLAAAALVVPWFCLHVVSNAEIFVPVRQAYSAMAAPMTAWFRLWPRPTSCASIAGMPGSYRYAHRGIEIPPAAAACIGIAFAALLVSLVTGPAQWRGIALGVSSAIGLFLIVFVLHDALDNPQWLTVDSRTEAGLTAYLTKARGEHPRTGRPLLPVLRKASPLSRRSGMFLALAAGGLGFFLAVTELCWGPAAAPASYSLPASTAAAARSGPRGDPPPRFRAGDRPDDRRHHRRPAPVADAAHRPRLCGRAFVKDGPPIHEDIPSNPTSEAAARGLNSLPAGADCAARARRRAVAADHRRKAPAADGGWDGWSSVCWFRSSRCSMSSTWPSRSR